MYYYYYLYKFNINCILINIKYIYREYLGRAVYRQIDRMNIKKIDRQLLIIGHIFKIKEIIYKNKIIKNSVITNKELERHYNIVESKLVTIYFEIYPS